MIKVVVFDLDDTLISEYEYVQSGFNVIANFFEKQYSLSADKVYIELMEGFHSGTRNIFNSILESYKISYTKKEILNIVEMYRNHKPKIKFYDDVKPILNYLNKTGIKTGIISDGYLHAQQNKLEAVCAKEYFDKIILTDELGRKFWKPHPKAFEIMRDVFDISYDQMMYVGDNPQKDFYIQKIYPVSTVRVMRKDSVYSNSKYYDGVKEQKRICSLSELQGMI